MLVIFSLLSVFNDTMTLPIKRYSIHPKPKILMIYTVGGGVGELASPRFAGDPLHNAVGRALISVALYSLQDQPYSWRSNSLWIATTCDLDPSSHSIRVVCPAIADHCGIWRVSRSRKHHTRSRLGICWKEGDLVGGEARTY